MNGTNRIGRVFFFLDGVVNAVAVAVAIAFVAIICCIVIAIVRRRQILN